MTEARRPERHLRETVEEWIAKHERELAARTEPPAGAEFSRYRELLEFRETLEAPLERRRRRRIAMGVALVVLAFAPLILTVRMPRTEVHLRVEAGEVTLRTVGAEPVLEALDVTLAEFSGARAIEVPRPAGPSDVVTTGTVRIEPGGPGAQVRLWQLILQERQSATFTVEDDAYRVRLDAPPAGVTQQLFFAVAGPVHVRGGGGLDAQSVYPSPRQLGIGWGEQDATLRFRPALETTVDNADGTPSVALATQIAVDSLSFFSRDRSVQGTGSPVVRSVSTVLEGTIRYEALEGATRELGPGDGIRFSDVEGIVYTFRAAQGRMIVDFRGAVRGMATGTGREGRSIMPTLFEWLEARHSLRLAWGGLAYLLTLALTLYQWWKSPR